MGSILNSVKKILGLDPAYKAFDPDVLMHINTTFAVLNQLGVGPEAGFMIEDDVPTWDAFLGTDPRFNTVKSYVCLKVRMLFDPPQTAHLMEAMNRQAEQLEWRISVQRESTAWVNPMPALDESDLILDGGEP